MPARVVVRGDGWMNGWVGPYHAYMPAVRPFFSHDLPPPHIHAAVFPFGSPRGPLSPAAGRRRWMGTSAVSRPIHPTRIFNRPFLSLTHTFPINPHRHAVPSHRFGCPYLASSRRTVLVSPFPASTVARGSPQPEEAAAIEWLSPELAVLDTTAAAATTADANTKRAGMRQLLRDALSSNPRDQVQAYYESGRKDAALWLKTSEFYRTVRGGGGGG